MGEIADWVTDQMQDAFPEWSPFGPCKQYVPKPVTCRVCGEKNLHWETTADGFKLFTKKNEMHVCNSLTKYRRKFG